MYCGFQFSHGSAWLSSAKCIVLDFCDFVFIAPAKLYPFLLISSHW